MGLGKSTSSGTNLVMTSSIFCYLCTGIDEARALLHASCSNSVPRFVTL